MSTKTKTQIKSSQIADFSEEELENAGLLYDLIRHLTIASGTDWDVLSLQRQAQISLEMTAYINDYLNTFVEKMQDENLKKHFQMIISSGLKPKLIAQYPEVSFWIQKAMEGLITNFLNQKEER